jgi:hypothetical protein
VAEVEVFSVEDVVGHVPVVPELAEGEADVTGEATILELVLLLILTVVVQALELALLGEFPSSAQWLELVAITKLLPSVEQLLTSAGPPFADMVKFTVPLATVPPNCNRIL